MGAEDWYRAEQWSAAQAEAFEARLARARPSSRAQYVRIQGCILGDSDDPADRAVARSMLERALALAVDPEHRDQMSEIAAHADLAGLDRRAGDPEGEYQHWRAAYELKAAYPNFSVGAELRLARLIAEQRWEQRFDEADRMLAETLGRGLIFGDERFEYARAKMRLATARGHADLAAAYARGAMSLVATDAPTIRRHPTVGRILRRGGDDTELERIARDGVAERGSAVIDEFRDDNGEVRWCWELIERLEGVEPGSAQAAEDAQEAQFAAVLCEVRAAGIAAYSLHDLPGMPPPTAAVARAVGPLLIRAYAAVGDDSREVIARALRHVRYRAVAGDAAVTWFGELVNPDILGGGAPPTAEAGARRRLKHSLGQTVGLLAGRHHAPQIAGFISDPVHGDARVWLFDALARGKEDAVESLLALVDHPDDGLNWRAFDVLCKLRSERAEPLMRAHAARERPARATTDEQRTQQVFGDIARAGLERLAAARAAGKSIR
ncbi:MAG: hypothetical protein J7513_11275 [Solirubrobacteraceae bacterium]|nr:hypothetical protein [Solirubrobacteraceae bacterium]